jgi:hypothetical protein
MYDNYIDNVTVLRYTPPINMPSKLTKSALHANLDAAKRELREISVRAERLKQFISSAEGLIARNESGTRDVALALVLPKRKRSNAVANTVKDILSGVARPMHVVEIVEELARRGIKSSIGTVRIALFRRPDEFVKSGRGIFSLKKSA